MHTLYTVQHNILVVEDDPTIALAVTERLIAEGFAVDTVHDGPAAIEAVAVQRPDLIVLDLMLPGVDGVEVCRQVQTNQRIPVVMLTARDEESDLLVGLAVGADDYLTKPFSMRELVARIRAVLRRANTQPTTGVVYQIDVGASMVTLDVDRRRVTRGNVDVAVTPTEFDLLADLVRRDGAVRTRAQLLYDVWGYRDGSGERTVDSHIRSLRRKLGDAIVRTVHGIGYAAGGSA